jgi:hypothetical protein
MGPPGPVTGFPFYILFALHPFYYLVNKAKLVHNFSYYVYFFYLHVSGEYVPIISRNNCIYATLRICHSVWMTVWSTDQTVIHTVRVTNTKCRIDCYFSWWWAHGRPKHVEKRNKHNKKNCASNRLYLQDYIGMHGQQNIKNPFYYYPPMCL